MSKPDWNEAPKGATHFAGKASFAKWYKVEDGEWMFFFGRGIWYKSNEHRQSFFDSLEQRP